MGVNSRNRCPFIINTFVFIEFTKVILMDRRVNSMITVMNLMITDMNSRNMNLFLTNAFVLA